MLIAINDIQEGPCILNSESIEIINYNEEQECYVVETPNYSYNITEEQLNCIMNSEIVLDLRVSKSGHSTVDFI